MKKSVTYSLENTVIKDRHLHLSLSLQTPSSALAQSVLAEVPNQVVSYFKMRGLEPPKPKAAPKA